MSEPTDINDNDPTDDTKLSSLYTRASNEQPSEALDAAILAKAKREVESATRPSRNLPPWTQSFSIAAVVVLSVTVVFMIDNEAPDVLEGSSPVVVMEQENTTTGIFNEEVLAKKSGRLEEKRQSKDNVPTDLAKAPQPESGSVVVMDKSMPDKAKARKKLEAPAMEADAEGVASFARSAQAPQAMGIMADQLDKDAKEGLSCQQLSEKDCLGSAACTLIQNKESKAYQCLPAKDHCELMFRQSEGTKKNCEDKQGCEFVPSQCYCPPDVLCVCGGGKPPRCKSKSSE